MKKLLLAVTITLLYTLGYSQNVGIGTNSPHPSAALDITDTAKGILIPRMTMNQRNAIQNPAEGLMVYQKDMDKGFYFFTGSQWQMVTNDEKNINRIKTQLHIANF